MVSSDSFILKSINEKEIKILSNQIVYIITNINKWKGFKKCFTNKDLQIYT